VKYKKPGNNGMKNLLKYLTYREGRNEAAVKQEKGQERWTDHGMGQTVAEIARHCADYQSQHVLLFTLVINPHPTLIAMVAPEHREEFVRELTEKTMVDYFAARDIDTGVEMSYCFHHRQTDDPQAPGLHNPHAHIILPGTYFDEGTGERMPLYFNQNKHEKHIDLLHQMTQEHTIDLMERYVGPEWEQRFDEIDAERERQQQTFCEEPYQNVWEDSPVWSGARQIDEHTSAVGMYGLFPDDLEQPDQKVLRFRAMLTGLPHDQADIFARYLSSTLKEDVNLWMQQVQEIAQLSYEDRAVLCQTLQGQSFDIDF
jgi:hypothetical protein